MRAASSRKRSALRSNHVSGPLRELEAEDLRAMADVERKLSLEDDRRAEVGRCERADLGRERALRGGAARPCALLRLDHEDGLAAHADESDARHARMRLECGL